MNKLDNKQQQALEDISQLDLSILDLDETDLVSSKSKIDKSNCEISSSACCCLLSSLFIIVLLDSSFAVFNSVCFDYRLDT